MAPADRLKTVAYSHISSADVLNRTAPYAEAFRFELRRTSTADSDEMHMAGAMLRQTVEKAKDLRS